jgi:SAM-dependent methyltransferase
LLPRGSSILDAGAGPGRDSAHFINLGYGVTIMEPSSALASHASKYTGHEVLVSTFQDMRFVETFDGIWACSSLLHVPEWELREVFARLEYALKPSGVLYYSFKYGQGMREKHGMTYMYMTEADIDAYIRHFKHVDMWVTEDLRPDRVGERWLNGILRKT